MPILVTAQSNGRPMREAFGSTGEALERARTLQARACDDVRIRDADGRWHDPEAFAEATRREVARSMAMNGGATRAAGGRSSIRHRTKA